MPAVRGDKIYRGVLPVIEFPVSGIEVFWWFPPLVAFLIGYAASLGGLSGAFMVLPYQISILGFTGPAVTPTNLVFNVIATPGGAYRFYREGRMVWPLAGTLISGTVPGVIIGSLVRVYFLPDPITFKMFAGLVLLFIGGRLVLDVIGRRGTKRTSDLPNFKITDSKFSLRKISFKFEEKTYSTSTFLLFSISLIVGIIGGTYGVGAGAILVPILVTFFRFPVYTISGAALLETFTTSTVGVISYTVISFLQNGNGRPVAPDWLLGGLLGAGGFLGIYLGARTQKYLPSRLIKGIIAVCILFVAVKYVIGYFIE